VNGILQWVKIGKEQRGHLSAESSTFLSVSAKKKKVNKTYIYTQI